MNTEENVDGRIAYEAYCESCGWKSYRGEQLPSWDEMLKTPEKADLVTHWNAVVKKLRG